MFCWLNVAVEYLDCLRDAVLSLNLIAESLGSASHRWVGGGTRNSLRQSFCCEPI
jgi:hypothetical protein